MTPHPPGAAAREADEPFTLEKLKAVAAEMRAALGPPPPRIHVSPHATGLPTGKPQTDDTREMVEHFERLGLVQRVPAAFRVGNDLVVHPDLIDPLNRKAKP